MPSSCMIDHFGPNLYKPRYDPVYGGSDLFAPECRISNQVKQIVGKTSDEKPGLVGCKAMTAGLVPSEGVFPLFYPVFNLGTTVVGLAHSFGLQPGVGYDESDPWEKLSRMPLHLADDPAGPVPGLRLILKIDKLDLHTLLGRPPHWTLQMWLD